jgi:hypothetical protein
MLGAFYYHTQFNYRTRPGSETSATVSLEDTRQGQNYLFIIILVHKLALRVDGFPYWGKSEGGQL